MDQSSPKMLIDISFRSLLKVLALVIIVVAAVVLFRIVMLFLLGLILAGALFPVVAYLKQRGIPRTATVALIAMLIGSLIALFAIYVIPEMFNQVTDLIKNFPEIKNKMIYFLPEDGPFRQMARKLIANSKYLGSEEMMGHALVFANSAMTGLFEFFLVLIFCVYLLLDKDRAYTWFRDFFKEPTRKKIDETKEEMSHLVVGYVSAQFLTSALAGIYTYIVMSWLNVPLALTLAVLAAMFDVLPVLGFFLAVIPAVALALTVSSSVALITLGAYMLYHVIENYLIIPMIYGHRMKVSSLVVLLSLLAAGTLGGVLPMILILPVVAAYPIIEKIWLAPYLGVRVVQKHSQETQV